MDEMQYKYFGKTVEEHLDKIKSQASDDDQQYPMAEKLLEHVQKEHQLTLSQLNDLMKEFCKNCSLSLDEAVRISTKRSIEYGASRALERLVPQIEEFVHKKKLNLDIVAHGSFFLELANRVRSFRKPDNTQEETLSESLSTAEQFRISPQIILFKSDGFSKTIDNLKSFITFLRQKYPKSPYTEYYQNKINEIIEIYDPMNISISKQYFLTLEELISVLRKQKSTTFNWEQNVNSIYMKSETFELLEKDLEKMRNETEKLKGSALIYSDSILNSMKIDWIGSATDCKVLFKFLKDNGYIKTGPINQFISSHFSFKGKNKAAESIGRLHTERDGKITEYGPNLTIPRN